MEVEGGLVLISEHYRKKDVALSCCHLNSGRYYTFQLVGVCLTPMNTGPAEALMFWRRQFGTRKTT